MPTRSRRLLKSEWRVTIECARSLMRNNGCAEVRRLRTPTDSKGLAFMELIVSSMLAAALLLVGHLGVLVHKRLVGPR